MKVGQYMYILCDLILKPLCFQLQLGIIRYGVGHIPPKKLKSEFLGTVKSCTLGLGSIDTTLYIVYYFFFWAGG